MEINFKKPYEISLWDDDLVFNVRYYKDGKYLTEKEYVGSLKNFESIEGTTTEITQYYKERKICVIGSNSMDTPIRAVNPKLVSKVNGENTLTFSLYSKYWDEDNEKFYDNPFLKLLVNERKIKLRYGAPGPDCKWYDLIIKNIQENSETKTFMYTAKDMFVNELSKSGFDIELDPELENNMGNITKLAGTVLEGSDWKLGEGSSELVQTKEEPLYEIILNQSITASDMRSSETITISSGKTIYGFYTPINNKEEYFQFLYVDGDYEVDDDYVIVNSKNWYIDGVTYKSNGEPNFAKDNSMVVSSVYRGDRLVRQVQTIYDATIDKYVYSYNEGTIYGYSESEYISPSAVRNFITSPNNFTSTSGWEVGGVVSGDKTEYPKLSIQGYPDIRNGFIEGQEYFSFLKYQSTKEKQCLFNSGFNDSRLSINGLSKNEKFVLRLKYAVAPTNNFDECPTSLNYITDSNPTIKIAEYTLNKGVYSIAQDSKGNELTLFTIKKDKILEDNKTIQFILTCKQAMSYSEMLEKKIGIFLNFDGLGYTKVYYIEDFQLFRQLNDADGNIIIPGGELKSDVKTKYYYYTPNSNYKSIEDVQFVYVGYEPQYAKNQDYNDNQYEKVRSITARESNRFNLIQTLCETFECWPKFEVQHNQETGEILLDKDDGYRQKKFVTFHEYIGKDNYSGFRYGINLKSIQRTLDSSGAVSKIIVKNNANQFAEGGFCSIARAKENPIKENFIYDFSYYIQQGLIGFSEVNNDLYLDINGYIGYYKKLRELNRNRELWIEEQAGLLADISNFQASYQTYKISVESANEELRAAELDIYNLTGEYYETWVKYAEKGSKEEKKQAEAWMKNNDFISKVNKLFQIKNIINQHTKLYEAAERNLTTAQSRFEALQGDIQSLANNKKALGLRFYKKYSRFIQEGSWIKEDYVDDNLYFLDAESTLHTSSQPKVTYNINVLELSQLEGYENYSFSLGDKTYVEDTEFFGWTFKNGTKTPYKEEIVVTEITIALDSPEQNTIKVQNYKTQFEDLFQRITATTQSVEYHTGEYGRAASVIDSNGNIPIETLQNSITNNSIRLENSKDQSVVWDETGITTTSASKPNEVVRLVSGGIFMSTDGGITWSTGLTGSGINASYITTGRLNTASVYIMNGSIPSFKWDGNGISAYQFLINENGIPYGFNISKFVRFDQYGIYGINGIENFVPSNEDTVWEKANYALTWKGFMLKNDDGSVRITSENDIQVLAGEQERIKIGRIAQQNDLITYGIRISNADGAPVMETDDAGELWLKNRLRVGTNNTSTVEIGYLDAVRAETEIHEVIHAGDGDQKFIVYEDGKMVAQGAEFHGDIYATGGKIGNMTIGEVQSGIESTKDIEIIANYGTTFQIDANNEVYPNKLDFRIVEKNISITSTNNIRWELSSNFDPDSWVLVAQDIEVSIPYEDVQFLNNSCYLKLTVIDSEGKEYSKFITIHRVSDGKHPVILTITSTTGGVYINGEIKAQLRAIAWRNGIDVTSSYDDQSFVWTKYDKNGTKDLTWSDFGPIIEIDHTEVEQKATFSCELIQE